MRSTWARRTREGADVQLPLRQYFLFVGGALLIMLFAADLVAPPRNGERVKSEVRLPVIRIHSERKNQDAVVFDTARPTFVAPVEQNGAITLEAVASAESPLTTSILESVVSVPTTEPTKPTGPKIQHQEISTHAVPVSRPRHHHAAFPTSGDTIAAAPESRMREAFAQALVFPRVRSLHTSNHIRPATKDERE